MTQEIQPGLLTRRNFLAGGALALAGAGFGAWWWQRQIADVFVARAASYEADLGATLAAGFAELGLSGEWLKGKAVLLKPNLVEPSAVAPHINTHPRFVQAVADAFRRAGARKVVVAEGQGHVRDTELVLDLSGLRGILDEARLPFVDLNHDVVTPVPNALGLTGHKRLYLPRAVLEADLVVSLPKMKTHHWVGATLAMKNLFGVLPGMVYGWPKTPLHQAGIEKSILDINATVAPQLAIVDGIVGMEGDGPIMGEPKGMGLIVMGTNFPAVDATCCRLMGIAPERVKYLQMAAGRLGPIQEHWIRQRGESLSGLVKPFRLLPHWEKEISAVASGAMLATG